MRGGSAIWSAVAVAVVSLALQRCATEPGRRIRALYEPPPGEAALAAGLKQFENGHNADSVRSLSSALDQGLSDADKVRAHKHLAFIHCATSRARQCREEFRKALAVDPAMELTPAEAGHPIWGPVFRSMKGAR